MTKIVPPNTKDEVFTGLLEITAAKFNYPVTFIEKDFWLCQVLANLASCERVGEIVFKGGTSLSKAFHAINRFSEDIDLSLTLEAFEGRAADPNKSQRMASNACKLIRPESLTKDGDDEANTQNSKMYKRAYFFPCEKGNYIQGVQPKIILEITALSSPIPFSLKPIQSFIGELIEERMKDNEELKAYYTRYQDSFAGFSVNVLDIERTFCEKALAIYKASDIYTNRLAAGEDTPLAFFEQRVRHLYDLTKLHDLDEIRTFLNSPKKVREMFDLCRLDDWTQQEGQTVSIADFLDNLASCEILNDPEKMLELLKKSFDDLRKITLDNLVPDIKDVITVLGLIRGALID